MILLVTPIDRASQCARALKESTGEEVVTADDLREAATRLRSESYLAVVLDQHILETEPDETDTVLQHLGTAILVQVNLAISSLDRLVREVRAAIERRKREDVAARRAVTTALYSELNSTVTALLLQCELAMEVPDIPIAVAEKLHSAHALVEKIRAQLQTE